MVAMHSKYSDIEALLQKSSVSLKSIEELYDKCLHEQTIPNTLLVEIKDYLGNLRSPLDYLNGKITGSARYFPICDHQNDFQARYSQINATTRSVLEKYQPYNNQAWFRWFNVLNNKNKHVALTPQRRTEYIQKRVSHPSGGSVSWGPGVTFGSGVSIMGVPIDSRTQMPVPNNMVTTEVITWVDFVFDNGGELAALPADLSALTFLKDCFQNVTAIIKEVEATLP